MQRWSIGQFEGASPVALTPAAGVRNPVLTAETINGVDAGFVADPFVIHAGDRWNMFFEVFDRGRGKGMIGYADSVDSRVWRYRGIVLEEPFHLSYPHVFSHAGSHFMVPETLGAAEVRLYLADNFPTGWRAVASLIPVPLADPTVVWFASRWWLHGCGRPRTNDELRVFHAETLTGVWCEHPASPVVSDDASIARPGGRTVVHDGSPVRYAQDCRTSYGSAVRAVRVSRLTPTDYCEDPVPLDPFQAAPTEIWSAAGKHHVDVAEGEDGRWLAWVDGRPR